MSECCGGIVSKNTRKCSVMIGRKYVVCGGEYACAVAVVCFYVCAHVVVRACLRVAECVCCRFFDVVERVFCLFDSVNDGQRCLCVWFVDGCMLVCEDERHCAEEDDE